MPDQFIHCSAPRHVFGANTNDVFCRVHDDADSNAGGSWSAITLFVAIALVVAFIMWMISCRVRPRPTPKIPELYLSIDASNHAPGKVHIVDSPAELDFIIKRPTGHTIALFTAPWCGHCQSYKAVFEEAAKLAIDNPDMHDVVWVMVDKTDSNFLQPGADLGCEITHFPFSAFYSGGEKSSVSVDQIDRQSAASGYQFVINQKKAASVG